MIAFESIQASIQAVYWLAGVIFGVVFFALAYWGWFRPSYRILRACVYRWSRSGAMIRLAALLGEVRGMNRALFRATRLAVEAEVLHPRPDRPPAWAGRDEQVRYRHALRQWKRTHKKVVHALVHESTPVIELDNSFDFYRAHDRIIRYFGTLDRFPRQVETRGRFVSDVRIASGCITFHSLLTGLLSEFDDNWPRVLASLPDIAKGDRRVGHELQEQIRSQLTCWLLWGPSIPACSCELWNGGNALQFGYGDENNAVPLFARRPGTLLDHLKVELEHHRDWGRTLAFPVSVRGVPCWGRHLPRTAVSEVQRDVLCGDHAYLESQEVLPATTRDAYYSAYVWLLLVLCDGDGSPLRGGAEPWHDMLPMFEHGNIADEGSYALLKRQLARKAAQFARDLSLSHPGLRLAYACALDDPGPDHPGKIHYATSSPSIREQLCIELSSQTDLVSFRELETYCACHLPDLIASFYRWIEEHVRPEDAEESHPAEMPDVAIASGGG